MTLWRPDSRNDGRSCNIRWVKRDRHAPRSGQSALIDRQQALRTMASLAKHSSMGLKSGL